MYSRTTFLKGSHPKPRAGEPHKQKERKVNCAASCTGKIMTSCQNMGWVWMSYVSHAIWSYVLLCCSPKLAPKGSTFRRAPVVQLAAIEVAVASRRHQTWGHFFPGRALNKSSKMSNNWRLQTIGVKKIFYIKLWDELQSLRSWLFGIPLQEWVNQRCRRELGQRIGWDWFRLACKDLALNLSKHRRITLHVQTQ